MTAAAASFIRHSISRFSRSSSCTNAWNFRIRESLKNHNNALNALLLYREMPRNGCQPNNSTFPFVAMACAKLGDIRYSKIIHSHVLKSPFWADVFAQTAMLDAYVKCNRLDYAYKVFERMPERDVAAWNAIIMGSVQTGFTDRVLGLFREMRFVGLESDAVTVMALTQSVLSTLEFLKAVHSFGLRVGVDSDVSVANTWVSAYAKCGDLCSAKSVFDWIEKAVRSIVSWNAVIGACSSFNDFVSAFEFYVSMLHEEFRPDISTILSLAASCSQPEALTRGILVHCHAIRGGCDQDIAVVNTFISMYSKCGDICSARFLFDSMSARTCVSWTAMIGGYVEKGYVDGALALFHAMEESGETPDVVTVLSLISGCGQTGLLDVGRWIDSYAKCKGFKGNVMVCNALIDMYAKCGSIFDARKIFSSMSEKTVVSWTSMIAGYALNGNFIEALNLFDRMIELDLKPNHITFLAVLQACSHSGFLDKGCEYFNMMNEKYNISPGLDHYSCMVDLLGRKGQLKEALGLIRNMSVKPDAGMWGALLSACKIHRNVEIGECAASRLFELEPHVAAPYVEMANIYASAGRWDGVARIRSMMKCNKVRKYPGESVVQINGKNHAFTVEDREHSQGAIIYMVLDSLSLLAVDEGYIRELDGTVEQDL